MPAVRAEGAFPDAVTSMASGQRLAVGAVVAHALKLRSGMAATAASAAAGGTAGAAVARNAPKPPQPAGAAGIRTSQGASLLADIVSRGSQLGSMAAAAGPLMPYALVEQGAGLRHEIVEQQHVAGVGHFEAYADGRVKVTVRAGLLPALCAWDGSLGSTKRAAACVKPSPYQHQAAQGDVLLDAIAWCIGGIGCMVASPGHIWDSKSPSLPLKVSSAWLLPQAKFVDRTILHMDAQHASCSLLLPDGRKAQVAVSAPVGVEGYVRAAVEFAAWGFRTPAERGQLLRMQALVQVGPLTRGVFPVLCLVAFRMHVAPAFNWALWILSKLTCVYCVCPSSRLLSWEVYTAVAYVSCVCCMGWIP